MEHFKTRIKLYTLFLFYFISKWLVSQNQIEFIEKIVAEDRQANDQFGWAIDSDTSFLIVGVPDNNEKDKSVFLNDVGAVYVYRMGSNEIKFHQKLIAPRLKEGSFFGNAIALHNDVLVIGAQGFRIAGKGRYEREGAIYIYRLKKGLWEFEQFILNPNKENENNGRFGYTVDIHGDYIVAGDGLFNSSVSLIKYSNTSWEITDMLLNQDTTFGCDASIYEKTIVIGSKHYTNNEGVVVPKGKAIIYSIGSDDKFKLENTLSPDLDEDYDLGFGSKVKVYHNIILIGGETSSPLIKSGSLYIYNFDRRTYVTSLDTVLKADFPLSGDWFGHSFDYFKNLLVIGAMGNTIYNNRESEYFGAAYIYERIDKKWHFIRKEHAINPTDWDKYGFSVSIFDADIFIGCRLDDEDENEKNKKYNAGAVYRYSVIRK